jgi:hypothetical protein
MIYSARVGMHRSRWKNISFHPARTIMPDNFSSSGHPDRRPAATSVFLTDAYCLTAELVRAVRARFRAIWRATLCRARPSRASGRDRSASLNQHHLVAAIRGVSARAELDICQANRLKPRTGRSVPFGWWQQRAPNRPDSLSPVLLLRDPPYTNNSVRG